VQRSSQIVTTNKPTPNFLQTGCPSCCQTKSVKALKGKHISISLTRESPIITEKPHIYPYHVTNHTNPYCMVLYRYYTIYSLSYFVFPRSTLWRFMYDPHYHKSSPLPYPKTDPSIQFQHTLFKSCWVTLLTDMHTHRQTDDL